MLQSLINVLKRAGGKELNFTFVSDSTCSLRLLMEDIQSTNVRESNIRIQLKNFIKKITLLGTLKAQPFDLLTRAQKDSIGPVNSIWYHEAITPRGDKFVDMLEDVKTHNTFLTAELHHEISRGPQRLS